MSLKLFPWGWLAHPCHFFPEQYIGRLLQKTEENCWFSSNWCTWRNMARAVGCITSPAHITETDCVIWVHINGPLNFCFRHYSKYVWLRIVEFVGVFHDEDSNLFLQFWSPLFCFFYVLCYIEIWDMQMCKVVTSRTAVWYTYHDTITTFAFYISGFLWRNDVPKNFYPLVFLLICLFLRIGIVSVET